LVGAVRFIFFFAEWERLDGQKIAFPALPRFFSSSFEVFAIISGGIMNTLLLRLYVEIQVLACREEGQDLVEYALVVALIALGATVSMSTLGKAINTEFSKITSIFNTNT
jgi:pilus assembly protein Flp/PilA